MKIFLDTEFIEDGKTIDLVSIGLVAEGGRKYYAQSLKFDPRKASEWVEQNVLAKLTVCRALNAGTEDIPLVAYGGPVPEWYQSLMKHNLIGIAGHTCPSAGCPWRSREQLRAEVLAFCDPARYGGDKPEFWGYYADYDWVALCQLFGTMMDLPDGFPMYCRDLKQWADDLGNPKLPEQDEGEHNALADALWNRLIWEYLSEYEDEHMGARP